MIAFTDDQWIIVILVFLLGAVIGMALMAGGKWKRRYREEVQLRREDAHRAEALEAENTKLRAEIQEMGSLRNAAVKSERADAARVAADRVEVERSTADRREGERRAEQLEVERLETERRESERRQSERRTPL